MTPELRAPASTETLKGLKYFRIVRPLLERLHDAGTERDRAGNRSLHYDQYCALVLLMLFNPTVRSLRSLQQASELSKVQETLGVARTSLGSLSESSHVFDPDLLLPIIGELAAQLRPAGRDPRLKDVRHILTAVDGTIVKALPRLAEAMWLKTKDGKPQHAWRLHTHFDVECSVPTRMERTDARNQGASNEKAVLRRHLESDHCYVSDRGYAYFALFNAIVAVGSSYVCRLRDNSNFEGVEERPLTAADSAAGVLRDAVVHLGMGSKEKDRPNHPVRLVVVKDEPHVKRGGRKGKTAGPASTGFLLIATNLMDVPAEIIALIYRYWWTIEVLFRTLKSGCRIEERRFEDVERVLPCLGIYLIVAWRTLFACHLGRECPDLDCEVIFEPAEWKAVWVAVHKEEPPPQAPKLSEMVHLIASLGGYIERRHSEPGAQTLWIGMQRMYGLAWGWETFGPDTKIGKG